jgi:hypothetical protein
MKTLSDWYRLVEQGDAGAQFNLGWMYDNGQGVVQDYKEAIKWYRLAAEQGHANAQYNLGCLYDEGEGVVQDYKEAVKWYRLAAEQGVAQAQNNLGVMYANGRGVAQDYKKAVKWYRLAAEQGLADAQTNLGGMYDNGQGVTQDAKEAIKWYRLAAEQGYVRAQNIVGFAEIEDSIKDVFISIRERSNNDALTGVDGDLSSDYDEKESTPTTSNLDDLHGSAALTAIFIFFCTFLYTLLTTDTSPGWIGGFIFIVVGVFAVSTGIANVVVPLKEKADIIFMSLVLLGSTIFITNYAYLRLFSA